MNRLYFSATLILTFLFSAFPVFSQNNPLLEINKTWHKFEQSFESLDADLFASIHLKDLVRVAGGNVVIDYDNYLENYRQRFKQNKENGISLKIELRFLERVYNEDTSSERGIYKMTRSTTEGDPVNFYGKFHVIMRKVGSEWKILMDYDSSEENTIGEDDFDNALPLEDITSFSEN